MSDATISSPRSAGFLRARLGSLLSFAPLGVWTFVHLWNNLAAFQGEGAWEQAVTTYPHPPMSTLQALLFAVDTTNSKPGFSGEFWISDVRLVR